MVWAQPTSPKTPTTNDNNANKPSFLSVFDSATVPPPSLCCFGALSRHRTPQSGHTIGIDGKVLVVRTEIITHNPIYPEIEDQGIEPTPIRPPIVHPASSVFEENTPAVKVPQLQITIPVQSDEVRKTHRFEPADVGLCQRHSRINAAGMAIMPSAGIRRISHRIAIVPERHRQRIRGPQRVPFVPVRQNQGPGRSTPSSRVKTVVLKSPSRVAGSS